MANASNMKCYYFIGPGFISFWLGIVLYFSSIIYNFILETLNEDDDEVAVIVSYGTIPHDDGTPDTFYQKACPELTFNTK